MATEENKIGGAVSRDVSQDVSDDCGSDRSDETCGDSCGDELAAEESCCIPAASPATGSPITEADDCCMPDPDMPAGCCAMDANNISVFYGGKQVLRDVSLKMAPGRITAIIGPSGCGKSTFLSTLNRMSDLTSGCRVTGDIRLEGKSILGPDTDLIALRRRVGMIFQRPQPLPTLDPQEHPAATTRDGNEESLRSRGTH